MLGLRRKPEPLPRTVGWAVLGVTTIFLAVGVVTRATATSPLATTLAGVAALACCAAHLIGPANALVPSAVLVTAAVAVLTDGTASSTAWFVVVILAGSLTLRSGPAVIIGYWLAAVLMFVVEAAYGRPDTGWPAWIAGTTFGVVCVWFGRRQLDLNTALREAQTGLAAKAQADERNRIARELHDVIAHSLTVSLMHVTSARLAVRDDPADAERALAEAERLGRASLDEVRHAVGLLRTAGDRDPSTPLPGSTDLPALVEQFRGAGADVRAGFDGDLDALPATVGLAAYRIVQESLTNAVKHAPGTRATVRVAVTARCVELDVDSSGAPGRGAGLGLVGMRERAHALGGRCEAGPGGSGWLVHAELPL